MKLEICRTFALSVLYVAVLFGESAQCSSQNANATPTLASGFAKPSSCSQKGNEMKFSTGALKNAPECLRLTALLQMVVPAVALRSVTILTPLQRSEG